jgi:hypothetical protein
MSTGRVRRDKFSASKEREKGVIVSDLYRTASGSFVAGSDDGTEARTLGPGEKPPPGWHLVTQAEFEQNWGDGEPIVEDVVTRRNGVPRDA